MKTRRAGWRLLLIVTFLVMGIPFVVAAFFQIIYGGIAWLTGSDEEAIDKILLGPPMSWAVAPMDWISDNHLKEGRKGNV